MKVANQLQISPLKEGTNVLKVYPSHKMKKTWTRPVSINLLLTTRCNSKCVTCDSWKLTDHDDELVTEDYKRLAAETAELDIPIVTIGGGEPTLRKDLWEIISFFKRHQRVVQLTTNALTMGTHQRQKMYAAGLDRVTISMDSHLPKTYEVIRGVPGAEKVLQNVKDTLAEKPEGFEIDTNTVLCKDNVDTFLDTIDLLIGMGVPKVNFSAVTTSGVNYLMTETKEHLVDIPISKIEHIVQGLLERKSKTSAISASTAFIQGMTQYYKEPDKLVYPCYAGYLTLDVFQDGAVHGCGNLPKFANVKNASLRTIWYGPDAEKNRQNMAEGKCPNCYLSCKIELAIASTPSQLPKFAVEKLRG